MHRDLEPKGETLQRAIRWISAERDARPERAIAEIVDEAGPRFDLAPIETEYLWKTFVAQREP
jgi:hypothetical protein